MSAHAAWHAVACGRQLLQASQLETDWDTIPSHSTENYHHPPPLYTHTYTHFHKHNFHISRQEHTDTISSFFHEKKKTNYTSAWQRQNARRPMKSISSLMTRLHNAMPAIAAVTYGMHITVTQHFRHQIIGTIFSISLCMHLIFVRLSKTKRCPLCKKAHVRFFKVILNCICPALSERRWR